MNDAERRELEELRAERAIHRVMLRYARGVDSGDFERVRGCFHADAQVTWGAWFTGTRDESIAWLSDAIPKLEGTLHVFGTPWIDLDLESGTAQCETYAVNSARYPADASGSSVQNVAGTRYFDSFELRDGEWKLIARRNERVWVQNSRDGVSEPTVNAQAEEGNH